MMYRFKNSRKNHFATEPDAGCRFTHVFRSAVRWSALLNGPQTRLVHGMPSTLPGSSGAENHRSS